MATSLVKTTEIGFAEFASSLISETLSAVVTSMLNQEEQVTKLQQQTLLSPEQYAKENLTDEMVRNEIIRLFPTEKGKSEVDAGEPYTTGKDTKENPAIYDKIGYKLTKGDFTAINGKTFITSAGYGHIFDATRLFLAAQQLSIIRTVIARGIPRVYVDHGHITSKLSLRFETNTTTTTTSTLPFKINVGVPKIIAQPVNANRPEYLSLKADVLSEIEITFKTVIP
jgi:hypothetical protein